MALTPEHVVEKRFQATKFREGYDQDEVDDFLDEVVNELRRLHAENDELRSKLSVCEQRVAELSGGTAEEQPATSRQTTGAVLVGGATATTGDDERVDVRDDGRAEVAEPAPAGTGVSQALGRSGASDGSDAEAAAGVLALAQRIHDEHVRSGEQKRDQLISEAQQQAARLVSEAEQRQRDTLGSLEQQRTALVDRIDQLRTFERSFRTRLKSYLESQLTDLESAEVIVPDAVGEGEGGSPVAASASS